MRELKAAEIRELTPKEREEKLHELQMELMRERGAAAMGGAPSNPGRIKELRRSIARMLTVMREVK